MYIHIVRLGETIFSIANLYGVTIEQIIEDNGLQNIPHLIVGQSLVIVKEQLLCTVKPNNTSISPFFKSIEVNGYIVPNTAEADTNIVNKVGKYLTYITPSSYTVNADGSLNPLNDNAIVSTAPNYNIAPLMSISNAGEADFDPQLAHTIFVNEQLQNILFNSVLTIMETKGYLGLNINFERVFPEDRELYNEFLRRAVAFFHQYGYPVSTALVPKTYDMTTGEWWGGHDYKAQGEILDFVIIMTYDWGCVACPPMAIAPINEVRKVLDYAVTVIPRDKISMGVPFYGFDWTLPFKAGNRANLVDYETALQLALKYNVSIQYDLVAKAPFFNYIDELGQSHIVWYEDARSFYAKYSLVEEYSLRGVSYWSLNLLAPQNWVVLTNVFNVTKLV